MGNPALAEISKPDMIQVAVAELTKQATDAARFIREEVGQLKPRKGKDK